MWRIVLPFVWVLRRLGVVQTRGVLSDTTRRFLKAAETVEVFSLGGANAGNGPFHDAPILGSVVIANERLRRRIANRILLANKHNFGGFVCLGAEYGVRFRSGDTTFDLTFCFGCAQVWVNGSNGCSECGNIAGFPIPLFDKVLTEAGVPLPPPTKH